MILQLGFHMIALLTLCYPAFSQQQTCDDRWRKCELETIYCQRDVEDLGERKVVRISRKIEEYYRDLPSTMNACVRYERCLEWKEETCWLSTKLTKTREYE